MMLEEHAIRGHLEAARNYAAADEKLLTEFHLRAAEVELGIQEEKARADRSEDLLVQVGAMRDMLRPGDLVGAPPPPPVQYGEPADGWVMCPVCLGACAVASVEIPGAVTRCAACNGQGRVVDHGAPQNDRATSIYRDLKEVGEAMKTAEDISEADLPAAVPHYIRAIALMLAVDFGVRHRLG